jgi:hypothetical protein
MADYTLDTDALSEPDMNDADELLENEDGSVDVVISPEETEVDTEYDHYENIAESLDEETLAKLATDVIDGFNADMQSRKPWEETTTKGLSLLGIKLEELSEPFEGACSATHPLILEAAVKFQAKASKELFPANGPVKTEVVGAKNDQKLQQAQRVKDHMNYQLNTEMEEYFPDMERLLFYLPIVGLAFKKMYYDPMSGRPCAEFVPADQLVVPANAIDLKRCPRYTHLLYKTANEMLEAKLTGYYRDVEIGEPSKPELTDITKRFNELIGVTNAVSDQDEVYTLLEQHTYLDLPDRFADPNGLSLPYVITIDKTSNKVLSIRRNWKLSDARRQKRVWFVAYPFVPGFGFYSLGFIHLLGNFSLTLTSVIRSLVDSGQFANLQGGWKAKGIRIQDNSPHKPGEWKEIESTGQDIAKSLMPLQYKEPSQTLMAMLQYLEGRGQQFADSTENVINDSTNYGPVGTTLALLEASTKFFSGIHKRLHYAQKQEFKILSEINAEFLPKEYPFDVVGGERMIMAEDYSPAVDVIPVSDPNISSNAHRMSLAQTKLQVAQQFPGLVNTKAALREFFLALGDGTDPNQMIPPDAQPVQQDPVSDIIAAVKGQPIGAFPGQDHDAHIQVKTAWLEDPSNGKNPLMAGVVPVIQANMREHLLAKYQESMQGAMQGLQQEGAQDPSEAVMAEAAQRVAKANAVEGIEAGMNDPIMIAAQAQLMEAQTKDKAVEYTHMEKMRKLDIEEREAGLTEKKMGIDTIAQGLQFEEQRKKNAIDAEIKKKNLGVAAVSKGMDYSFKEKSLQSKAKDKPLDK